MSDKPNGPLDLVPGANPVIKIELMGQAQVAISAPMDDPVLCLGMIEMAKAIVIKKAIGSAPLQQSGIVIPAKRV